MGNERNPQQALFEIFDALHQLAYAEMCSNPTSPTASTWRKLANAIGEFAGHEEIGRASPVAEHQPLVLPPGYEHPIPPKGGAKPLIDPSKLTESPGDIRKRPDVAAEIERVKQRGGA